MTPGRSPSRRQCSALAGRPLVLFLTMLFLALTPVGIVLAAADQGGDRTQLAQDAPEPSQEKSPDDTSPQTDPTQPIESNEPPPEPIATESKPTEQPPTETKPTEQPPVESKSTEAPPIENVPTEEPGIDPTPTETLLAEPTATATTPPLPPDSGGPGVLTTLVVTKGLCDSAAYDPYAAASLAELLQNCAPYSTDATLTHTYLETRATITQGTIGSATSFDVQPGSFSLQEQLPFGYLSPVVGCESSVIGAYPLFFPPNGSTITSHIDAGDILTCHWFNVPIPPTTLVVIKGVCDDASFDPYTASSAALAQNCTQSSGDATFTFQQVATGGPNELTLTQTTVGSTTTFDIPNGNFSLREDIPSGYGEPVVSCYIAGINWDILPGVSIDTILGHIDLGDTYTCHWYNVQASIPSGSLTVIKYACGPLTQQIFSLCPIHKNGQEFDLLQWSADQGWVSVGTGVTDRLGRYTWTELPPGTYRLDELDGDWCRISSDNLVPGEKGITVMSGEEATVQVYNCAAKSAPIPVRVVNLLALIFRDTWNPAP